MVLPILAVPICLLIGATASMNAHRAKDGLREEEGAMVEGAVRQLSRRPTNIFDDDDDYYDDDDDDYEDDDEDDDEDEEDDDEEEDDETNQERC
eukprot:CAMPEP_0116546508 /NCGR_PEP_ID=MMETSP0397-20121206/3264_1 /TAXON_ID=216820 /ORGANISM="Cyclophora tenuis, Strain ECT3854" /LENGTH=93 /DNA_ID=CAMNT_0004070943 /DNA_START=48 /DNA_END=329 /DNA_ORIENTATION=-